GVQEAIQAIRQAVLSEFDVEVSAIELLRTGTILKTSSGKIQRSGCRKGFLAGELNAVYRWNRIQESTQGQAQNRSNKEEMRTGAVGTDRAGPCPVSGTDPVPTRFTPTVQEIAEWLVTHIAQRAQIDSRVVDLHAPFVQL